MKTYIALALVLFLTGCGSWFKRDPVIRYVVIAPDDHLLMPDSITQPPLRETFIKAECSEQREMLSNYGLSLLEDLGARDNLFIGLRSWKAKQLELYKSEGK